jgi:hypothetical protein
MSRLGALAVLLAVSCSNVVSPRLVKTKAAADFACAADQVIATQVTDTNWTAAGCGKRGSYTCWTSVGMGDGTCVREGEGPKQEP